MYSRTWHGVVPIEYREGFEKYEYETGVKDTQEIAVDYPEDAKYHLISDPIVVIQEVVSAQNPFA